MAEYNTQDWELPPLTCCQLWTYSSLLELEAWGRNIRHRRIKLEMQTISPQNVTSMPSKALNDHHHFVTAPISTHEPKPLCRISMNRIYRTKSLVPYSLQKLRALRTQTFFPLHLLLKQMWWTQALKREHPEPPKQVSVGLTIKDMMNLRNIQSLQRY